MLYKNSARIFLKAFNGCYNNSIRLISLRSSTNIKGPLMGNVNSRYNFYRKKSSSELNPTEIAQLNISTERKELMDLFPGVLSDVTEFVETFFHDKDLVDRIIRSIQYTIPKGKKIHSTYFIGIYKSLVDPTQLTPENIKMIRLLCWIYEMLAGTILIADDIVDEGHVRRHQTCWHLLEDVKLTAVNDILVMENLAYYMLKKYFSHLPCYTHLFEEFHKMYLTTMIGQQLDELMKLKDVQHFTMDKFKNLVYLKTSYPALCSPFALATKFIGIENSEVYHQTTPIFHEIGIFKQIENDYYGCYGTSKDVRVASADIETGQCTWLAIKCLELATPAQREIMIKCYGKKDCEKSKLVKQLYNQLNLPDLYFQYENETYNKLAASINNLSCGIPNDGILNSLNVFFSRI